MEKLSRKQMKVILGGDAPLECTAECADGTSVTCKGSDCIAIDGAGCNADGKPKVCMPPQP